MSCILVIEDDLHIGNLIEETLLKAGYAVTRAYSGTEALLLLQQEQPDLILLDLMLPGLSGEELLPRLKDIPVIVLSAKTGTDHKVELLLGGAVDYITKPFDMQELLARITVYLRSRDVDSNSNPPTLNHLSSINERHLSNVGSYSGVEPPLGSWNSQVIEYKDMVLHTDTHIVTIENTDIRLTRTEYAILKLLMQNPNQVVAKLTILDQISMDTPDCTEGSLKQHISNLRKKLREASDREYIEAVWGIGFRLC